MRTSWTGLVPLGILLALGLAACQKNDSPAGPFAVPPKAPPTPIILTVAGCGVSGYSGDGGPATSAEMSWPFGETSDSAGNIYFCDYFNNRVRKIDKNGIITTIAGNGGCCDSGDGGPATLASIGGPNWLAFDPSGDLYIDGDYFVNVRKVDLHGTITTAAGNGTQGYSGDGGPATLAALNLPAGMAFDPTGNLYFGDFQNNRVREVNTSGIITTIAGNGTSGFLGDGGPALSAEFRAPWGVAFDTSGNMYIPDFGNHRIREVNTAGIVTTIAGNGVKGYSGDGGPALSAELDVPIQTEVDASGNIYIVDWTNNAIRRVTPQGIITTAAGTGVAGFSGDGGPPSAAALNQPQGEALDPSGNLYISDTNNFRVRKVVFHP